MQTATCCFIGHREIEETEELREKLWGIIETLITQKGVDTFLFGSKSGFNSLCHSMVSEIKEKYPHIKRIYVRAEYPYISDRYREYLLEDYEDTYFPSRVLGAGRASYVERNYEMIDSSSYTVFYYKEKSAPTKRKSGTKIALDYATVRKKVIIKL